MQNKEWLLLRNQGEKTIFSLFDGCLLIAAKVRQTGRKRNWILKNLSI